MVLLRNPYFVQSMRGIIATLLVFLSFGEVSAQLRADFTLDKSEGCAPVQVQFTNRSTGITPNTTFQWNFGNGNSSVLQSPGAIFTEIKSYTVTLTITENGQSSVQTKTVTVHSPPTADFTVSAPKACLPAGITFTSTSQPGAGSIANYYWDFGDGATQQGYGSSMQHTYNYEQVSPVTLTVTNSYGCSNTIVKKDAVTIIPSIHANFSSSQQVLCKETDPVSFSNSSYGPGTLSYSWDYGDGGASTEKTPSYSFNKKGIYTVKLIVKSSEGCQTEMVRTNYLNVAQYSTDFNVPSLICTGVPTTFTPGTTPNPSNTSWEVNGTPMYGYYNGLSYNFPSAGTYTVKINNTFGTCPQSVTKTVSVKESPNAPGFISTAVNPCGAPSDVVFKDVSTNAAKWEWDFNYNYFTPAIQATTKEPTWNYTGDGYKNVYLRVTTADGCVAAVSKQILLQKPYVNAAFKDVSSATGTITTCETPIELTFFSSSAANISSYSWQFSDGTNSTEAEPRKKFTTIGNHWATLNYTTKDGCTGAITVSSITIYGTPNPNFTASTTETCGSNPIVFSNNAAHAQFWQWDFGDNTGFYTSSFSKQYTKEGTYPVTLTVSNPRCQATLTKTQYVKVLPPFAVISAAENTCDDTRGTVTLTHGSENATQVIWDFGDQSPQVQKPATVTEMVHTYTKNGSYTVSLTAINGACSLRHTRNVFVLLKQKPRFSSSATQICKESSLNVTVDNLEDNPAIQNQYDHEYLVRFVNDDYTDFKGSSYSTLYYWRLNYQGTLSNFQDNPSKIKAIVIASYFGCTDTTAAIPIELKGSNAAFNIVRDNKCWNEGPVVFEDKSAPFGNTSITSRTWSFGDGNTYTTNKSEVVQHLYDNPGSYPVTLRVTDASGCSNTTNYYANTARVNGPKANFTVSGGLRLKQNASGTFYNNTNSNGSNNTTYQWYINEVPYSTDYYPSYHFLLPGTYQVKLVASSTATGCSSTYEQEIVVEPFNYAFNFSVSFIGGRSCPPALVRFTNTSYNFTRVEWDFGDGFTLGNTNYPSHIYEKPGKYYVKLRVYGYNGLTGEFTDSVEVGEPIIAFTANSMEGCTGHSVEFTGSSENSVKYVWDYGDGNTLSTTSPAGKHLYNTPGTYRPSIIGTDKNGCSGSIQMNDVITIRPNPTISLSSTKNRLCLGETATITASGADTYIWSPSPGLNHTNVSMVQANPVTTATYQVKGTDDIGCEGSSSISLEVVQPQKVSVSNNTSICPGEEVKLTATGTDQYQWINTTEGLSSSTIPNPTAKPGATTTYTVSGSDQYNCFTTTADVTVRVMEVPTVNAGPDLEVMAGDAVTLQTTSSSDVTTWKWSPASYLGCSNCPNPVAKPLSNTQYVLTVTNGGGCTATDTLSIQLICEEKRVFVPNGFTPNGDGHNDYLMVKGIGIIKHMVVFNRWGDKVYEKSNFFAGETATAWNGTHQGVPVPPGTYVYFIEMQCPDGGAFTKKGTVTLLR